MLDSVQNCSQRLSSGKCESLTASVTLLACHLLRSQCVICIEVKSYATGKRDVAMRQRGSTERDVDVVDRLLIIFVAGEVKARVGTNFTL